MPYTPITDISERAANARVCAVSLRAIQRQAAWCSNYEFEDVICDVDNVDLISYHPGVAYEPRQWFARRLVWRPVLHHFTPYVSPGVQSVILDKDYDLLVCICMNPADLLYLSAIKGWRDRCRKAICVIVEVYAGWAREYAYHLDLLKTFDHIVLCFSGSVSAVEASSGRPCHHVPLGVDVLRFGPFPSPPPRCIDIYSMGRRIEEAHAALRKMAARREMFYVYDTIPGLLVQPRNHREHRDLIAACAKRSRFFVTYPAKIDNSEETLGQSEVGARFFEGAASGAVLIGKAPTIPAFREEFDWPDAIIDTGTTAESVDSTLNRLLADPERLQNLGRTNAIEAMRRFDWAYRWRDILRIAGMEPTARHCAREGHLQRLAAIAEAMNPKK